SYGPKTGEIDAVVKMGLEKWFQQQLSAGMPDESLNSMLSSYDAINLSNTEVVNKYPKGAQVLRLAIKDGAVDKDALDKTDKSAYRNALTAYMQKNGLKPQQELFRQFINQKILRATYTNNQLQELLTDFWFNHFNVSITKNDCAEFIPAYERDVIRPNVFGKFEDLLLATAKSPAMLLYLDNFSSSGTNTDMANPVMNGALRKRVANQVQMGNAAAQRLQKVQEAKKTQGLNENYAREVMELHTLGVDGGYTQQDVTQAARVLTGWTIYPMGKNGYGAGAMQQMIEKVGESNLEKRGFVHDGDFMFAANRHDNKEKIVLGKRFNANGGYEEGVELLKMLAHHPSTAQFISKKIAVRFVNDNPPKSLIDKMSKTFKDKDGDIRQVLITMVSSPEFWSKDALREKTKSPFELAISAARSLNADIRQPYQLYTWIDKMGQKMYYYQAPTGFPDKGQYWINTGALLSRMNFGLALASQRIPGIRIDLAALNNNHEPESTESALLTYSKIIMPERDLGETIKRLAPMLNDPDLVKKVDEAAGKTVVPAQPGMKNEDAVIMDKDPKEEKIAKSGGKSNRAGMQTSTGNNSVLSQVVGVIIGSPEFQRK
ncbi:MAG TPA: DUF1800 domain-containing protein, partial [Sphingobacteriaceae bacterium]|nr:DUF1800 domain-containing protein [Sphingobacteriaceae bacterium]